MMMAKNALLAIFLLIGINKQSFVKIVNLISFTILDKTNAKNAQSTLLFSEDLNVKLVNKERNLLNKNKHALRKINIVL